MADANTWWAVDLGGQYDIATVNVTTYTSGSNIAFGNYYPRCYIHFLIHLLNDTGSIIDRTSIIVLKCRLWEKLQIKNKNIKRCFIIF